MRHSFPTRRSSDLINLDFSIVRIDVDRFKIFNDLFGFQEGDKLLCYIGKFLKQIVSHKMIYGYFQADHFLLCIPTRDLDIEKLDDGLSTYLQNYNSNFEFNIRFGIYNITDRSIDIS